jgi:hypothetical protein
LLLLNALQYRALLAASYAPGAITPSYVSIHNLLTFEVQVTDLRTCLVKSKSVSQFKPS